MNLLLVGINAKYSHTALAVRSISAFLNLKNIENTVVEYTINDSYESIFYDILSKEPKIIGFSTYIWNISLTKRLISDLKSAIPNTKIILGGPEAGYSKDEYAVDKVIVGEGEVALYNYLSGENIICDFERLPFPYSSKLEIGKMAYYESSRGCPYRCSYCISAIEKNLKYKEIESVKRDIDYFIAQNIGKVKFIDRTHNANKNATQIYQYIIEKSPENTSFHFEVKPELFCDKDIETLKTARKGLIQFEIGLQSLNQKTLFEINRNNDIKKAFHNITELLKANNIRIHLDLIAGLPFEDLNSFIDGFNTVYGLTPHILQLGFLKILNGAPIKEQLAKHQIVYSNFPPYQIIKNRYLSTFDIMLLKDCENGLDFFSNRGFFKNSLLFLLDNNAISPFEFFKMAGAYLKNIPPLSLPNSFSLFYKIYQEHHFYNIKKFHELLILDYQNKAPNKPIFRI